MIDTNIKGFLETARLYLLGLMPQRQQPALAAILLQAMPEAKIETVPQPPDLRDYRVCFDKIQKNLGFVPEFEAADGIVEIREAIRSGRLGDPDDPRYKNA